MWDLATFVLLQVVIATGQMPSSPLPGCAVDHVAVQKPDAFERMVVAGTGWAGDVYVLPADAYTCEPNPVLPALAPNNTIR